MKVPFNGEKASGASSRGRTNSARTGGVGGARFCIAVPLAPHDIRWLDPAQGMGGTVVVTSI